MFVGVGAGRVRSLFEEAKKASPCIIFIDEIDAIGKARDGKGGMGGHDEKEQTLNQLLVEMDGFDSNANVIVLAATNRVDVLDKALLRPGRFDRTIHVSLPDIKGREKILAVHSKKIPLDPNIDLSIIARGTARFSGAELANLINEAAIIAAKQGKEFVSNVELEYARDKVLMGPERKSLVMSEKEKITTAYHEAGHTLISLSIEDLDKVHKVSIIPRGRALGVTQTIAEENQLSISKTKAMNMIAMLMGGRAAEELKFNHFTTGASNDIERATSIARSMVCEWGMSDLGPINLHKEHNGLISSYDFAESTKKDIDLAISKILEVGYNMAKSILERKNDHLELIANELILKETLDTNDLNILLENKV
jgi:cell division protease FtsH